MIIKTKENQGFTLLELTFVILISGLILGSLSAALLVYIQEANIKKTQSRLADVDKALQTFLSLNGRYPCAAPLTAALNTATFGVEADPGNCAAAAGGTSQTAGTAGRIVRIGALPVRTLNLPDDYEQDAWGNRFTFAVTEVLASAANFNIANGAIFVIDSAGAPNSVITPAGSAHYVIVSHGKDGKGATSMGGVAGAACNAAALDGENCNGNATFRATMTMGSGPAAGFYDDLMMYRVNTDFNQLPSGAVVAFNAAACPAGWTAVPAATIAGRAIVGTGVFNDVAPGTLAAFNYALGLTGGVAQYAFQQSEVGISPLMAQAAPAAGGGVTDYALIGATASHENRPPFVALLYCQKT
jgi:prepilin-type N-terminal cleavage/methylation domain-containing protein